jgi:hypothetical protein
MYVPIFVCTYLGLVWLQIRVQRYIDDKNRFIMVHLNNLNLIFVSRRVLHSATKVRSNPNQGCQMVYFQTKNLNLGKFWRAFEYIMLEYFMTI